jgi:hypothetical protein
VDVGKVIEGLTEVGPLPRLEARQKCDSRGSALVLTCVSCVAHDAHELARDPDPAAPAPPPTGGGADEDGGAVEVLAQPSPTRAARTEPPRSNRRCGACGARLPSDDYKGDRCPACRDGGEPEVIGGGANVRWAASRFMEP